MKPIVEPPALLGADQADNRIRLFNPFIKGDRKPDLWAYPKAEEPKPKFMPTDAKRVEWRGVTHILAAYHGRVRLVRYADHHLVKDYPSYGSCHSAELLPDGMIVTANSNDGMLRVHQTSSKFVDLKLPYAHGVTWDKKRKCLWALGDLLYRLSYNGAKLTVERSFPLPLDPTGHDLFPPRNEAKLLVSNNKALFLFDIAESKFEKVSDLEAIKSVSQHLDGSIWATDPADQKGYSSWQTDSVVRVRPTEPVKSFRNEGSRFYKARWWQRVDFSY